MRLKILDGLVRQNVEVFLKILRKVQEKQTYRSGPEDKVFHAWLNRKTGQFSFVEIPEETQNLSRKDWKPIRFMYQYDPKKGELAFCIYEADEKKEVFHSQDLTDNAFQVLQKTMRVFSQITQQLKGPSNLDTKISVLSRLIIHSEVVHKGKNVLPNAAENLDLGSSLSPGIARSNRAPISTRSGDSSVPIEEAFTSAPNPTFSHARYIFDLWHEVDRINAESLLAELPVGTYFFRKDLYAQLLEEQLERQLGKKIKCYTLTYSQENDKVTDHTFVFTEGSWQIYNDDPSLKQQQFLDVGEILISMKGVLKYPLYRK